VGLSKDKHSQLPADNNAELVFGLVYGIGTDAEKVVHLLKDYLQQFGYETHPFRISQHLRSLNLGIEFDDASPVNLMHALMDAGNEARSKAHSDEILALSAIKEVLDHRPKDEHGDRAASFNVAHVIRSLKRPEEVALLRQIYRPGFYLIGIAADDDEQESFLVKRKGLSSVEARTLIERDQGEHELHGQRMRDTFYLSDVFLELRESRYEAQLERFLELIFGRPFITPTKDEHAMFMAYASAARSAQVGRQVGSAITTPRGEVIAVGFNEVPSRHGGPYWEGDAEDHRDHKEGSDSNLENRKKIVESILHKLEGTILDEAKVKELVRLAIRHVAGASQDIEGLVARVMHSLKSEAITSSLEEVKRLIDTSDLREITEYGRAVHAEMDAILTCARLGITVSGNCLYTTTFPCHNCTRHIIASGIRKLVYIEPYPKSKAKDLHSDAICFDEEEAMKSGKIPFSPFVGIGPRRYLDLFSTQLSGGVPVARKGTDGKPVKWEKRSHRGPRVAMEPFNYLEREQKALDESKAKLRVLAEPGENRDGQSTS
jgi:deoxycytidylate deaminase